MDNPLLLDLFYPKSGISQPGEIFPQSLMSLAETLVNTKLGTDSWLHPNLKYSNMARTRTAPLYMERSGGTFHCHV